MKTWTLHRRADGARRPCRSLQCAEWGILGGLLVPCKAGSSIPVRAGSGQRVATSLHPNAHTPILELTNAMLLQCRTATPTCGSSPLGVKLPLEWRPSDCNSWEQAGDFGTWQPEEEAGRKRLRVFPPLSVHFYCLCLLFESQPPAELGL